MRVISGTARGTQLKTPAGMHTRPTADRVKEAMFSIIQFDIPAAQVLDLFGGTGQLGIEALSRGAKSAVFVDEREDYTIRWIVPNTQKKEMEPILIELPQGGESFVMDPHSGEEFGYVLEGAVILMVGEDRHIVHKGETFYLSGKKRHYLKNEKKTTAKVLWVSTPPLF